MSPKAMIAIIIALVAIVIASNSIFIISEMERGVKVQLGKVVDDDLSTGLHFKVPFAESVNKFDARILTLDEAPRSYLTKDKETLEVDSFVKWQIRDTAKFYTAASGDRRQAEDLLGKRVADGLRNEFGTRTKHEVVSGERDELMAALTVKLNQNAEADLGIHILDVRVKRIDLPNEVRDSVYSRMRAERERIAQERRSLGKEQAETLRAAADKERTVIMAEAYRKAQTVRGTGDAEAAAIYAGAYGADQEFYSFYRSMEAYKTSFASKNDIMLLQPNSEFFKYLRGGKN